MFLRKLTEINISETFISPSVYLSISQNILHRIDGSRGFFGGGWGGGGGVFLFGFYFVLFLLLLLFLNSTVSYSSQFKLHIHVITIKTRRKSHSSVIIYIFNSTLYIIILHKFLALFHFCYWWKAHSETDWWIRTVLEKLDGLRKRLRL